MTEKSKLLQMFLKWNSTFEKFKDWFQESIDRDALSTDEKIRVIHQNFELFELLLEDIGEPSLPVNDVIVLFASECLLCDENNTLHEVDVTAAGWSASEDGMFLCDWQIAQLEKAGVHPEIIDYFMDGFVDADPRRRKL